MHRRSPSPFNRSYPLTDTFIVSKDAATLACLVDSQRHDLPLSGRDPLRLLSSKKKDDRRVFDELRSNRRYRPTGLTALANVAASTMLSDDPTLPPIPRTLQRRPSSVASSTADFEPHRSRTTYTRGRISDPSIASTDTDESDRRRLKRRRNPYHPPSDFEDSATSRSSSSSSTASGLSTGSGRRLAALDMELIARTRFPSRHVVPSWLPKPGDEDFSSKRAATSRDPLSVAPWPTDTQVIRMQRSQHLRSIAKCSGPYGRRPDSPPSPPKQSRHCRPAEVPLIDTNGSPTRAHVPHHRRATCGWLVRQRDEPGGACAHDHEGSSMAAALGVGTASVLAIGGPTTQQRRTSAREAAGLQKDWDDTFAKPIRPYTSKTGLRAKGANLNWIRD